MTYIDLINAFEKWLETNYLPSSAQLLWYKLIALFNKAGWSEWVIVDNRRLMSITQIESEKTLIRNRDKLIENKFFEFQKGKKGSPNKYKINTVNFTGQTTVQMGVKTTVNMSNINRIRQDKDNDKLNKFNLSKNIKKKNKTLEDVFKENEFSKELESTLRDFIDMRKAIKKPMTARALELLIRSLERLTNLEAEQIEILNQSIEHCWQTVYPLKKEEKNGGNNTNITKQYKPNGGIIKDKSEMFMGK